MLFRDVLAGHSVVDSSQADLPVIVAAVVDPLTNHLQVQNIITIGKIKIQTSA
jgi:hypothetical protein